jgi:hypothetical protein
MNTFTTFSTWAEVLDDAHKGAPLFYHAPLDVYPVRAYTVRVYKNGKIRIQGGSLTFTVDSGHLNRFRKRVAS